MVMRTITAKRSVQRHSAPSAEKTLSTGASEWQRAKSTKMARHGDENFVNTAKVKRTLQQHIAENPSFWRDISGKRKQTCLEKHNDPNWNNR